MRSVLVFLLCSFTLSAPLVLKRQTSTPEVSFKLTGTTGREKVKVWTLRSTGDPILLHGETDEGNITLATTGTSITFSKTDGITGVRVSFLNDAYAKFQDGTVKFDTNVLLDMRNFLVGGVSLGCMPSRISLPLTGNKYAAIQVVKDTAKIGEFRWRADYDIDISDSFVCPFNPQFTQAPTVDRSLPISVQTDYGSLSLYCMDANSVAVSDKVSLDITPVQGHIHLVKFILSTVCPVGSSLKLWSGVNDITGRIRNEDGSMFDERSQSQSIWILPANLQWNTVTPAIYAFWQDMPGNTPTNQGGLVYTNPARESFTYNWQASYRFACKYGNEVNEKSQYSGAYEITNDIYAFPKIRVSGSAEITNGPIVKPCPMHGTLVVERSFEKVNNEYVNYEDITAYLRDFSETGPFDALNLNSPFFVDKCNDCPREPDFTNQSPTVSKTIQSHDTNTHTFFFRCRNGAKQSAGKYMFQTLPNPLISIPDNTCVDGSKIAVYHLRNNNVEDVTDQLLSERGDIYKSGNFWIWTSDAINIQIWAFHPGMPEFSMRNGIYSGMSQDNWNTMLSNIVWTWTAKGMQNWDSSYVFACRISNAKYPEGMDIVRTGSFYVNSVGGGRNPTIRVTGSITDPNAKPCPLGQLIVYRAYGQPSTFENGGFAVVNNQLRKVNDADNFDSFTGHEFIDKASRQT
jgi:hypothetical protein